MNWRPCFNSAQEKTVFGMNKYNLAVVGATGAVGRTILSILHQRGFPANEVHALASSRSAGSRVPFGAGELTVQNLEDFDFSRVQIGLFSPGANVSRVHAPRAAEAGCWVVDNTSHFRYMEHIPLVVSEVNPQHLERAKDGIIANPNCSTMQMMVALKPIVEAAGIARINIASYQSVSGTGSKAMEELNRQVARRVAGGAVRPEDCQVYSRPIAFNTLPHIDVFQDNHYTKEEMKMVWETQKIFDDPTILVNPTCVRVPVMVGHALAVHLETRNPLSAEEAIEHMRAQPGLRVHERPEDYPTQLEQGDGVDEVHVGRVRKDISHPNGLDLWVVADNLRKGAALNAVQLAELLVARGMV